MFDIFYNFLYTYEVNYIAVVAEWSKRLVQFQYSTGPGSNPTQAFSLPLFSQHSALH